MRQTIKRGTDLALASAATILLSPLMAYIAAKIARAGDGPILYRGRRVGLGGQLFQMYKFRTMVADADRLGGPHSPADDPRLTPFGARLRRYKLDELPQFLNVIQGKMSIVGPRPQVPDEVMSYSDEERIILTVRPGLTDWSSLLFRNEAEILAGSSDPDRTYRELIRPDKMRLGVDYARNWTFTGDVRIMIATMRVLCGGDRVTPARISQRTPGKRPEPGG